MLADELPVSFVRAFAFAFGAIWGSFANVLIYRWPREESVVSPPSHCGACGKPVRAFDNVPILSWFLLRGRCRACGARFSFRYPAVELIFAVISSAIAERLFVHGPRGLAAGAALALYLVRFAVAFALLVASFIDLDEMLVPWFIKWFAVPALAAAWLLPNVAPSPSLLGAIAGAGVGYLGLRALFIDGYQLLMGRRGMGVGDAEILLVVGAISGIPGVLFSLGAGAVQGVIATGIVWLAGGRIGPAPEALAASEDDAAPTPEADGKPAKMKVPFVPFLALAALEYLLGADVLVDGYLRWIGGG